MNNFPTGCLSLLLQAFPILFCEGGETQTAWISEPSADRWMYPSNSTPGVRPQASTFSALPNGDGVDDRFGQFLIKFDTAAAGIPAGLGAPNYDISSITLTATISQDKLFIYDPTPDPWFTYGLLVLPDEDAGRPLELFGAGFRGDFNSENFQESSPFGGVQSSQRNAFAAGFDPLGSFRDLSNSVSENFDPLPWATGQIPALEAGLPVPVDTVVNFTIDLTVPGVADYVRTSLDRGYIWLTLSSLHPAIQQDGEFVAYYTKDDPVHQLFGDAAPTLRVVYSLTDTEPPPAFTSFQRDAEGIVSLEFPGKPGFTYTLEASTDMMPDSWRSLETFSSPTPTNFRWQAVSSATKRFFRISRTTLSP